MKVEDPQLALLIDALDQHIKRLEPPERRRRLQAIGRYLRRSTAQRLRAQSDPEGRPWAPRNTVPYQGTLKTRMFRGLSKIQRIRLWIFGEGVAVGYAGRAARIARIHQYGERAPVSSRISARYPERRLLGITSADREAILRIVTEGV